MYRGILTLMAVAGAAAATAAPAATQTVEILPQLGVSTVKYDSDMFDSSTGLGLEIGGKLRVGRRFYVEPGVFFAWGGADISDQTDEGTLTLGDFRVPLVVGLKVVASRALEVRVFAGGGAAFVTSVSRPDRPDCRAGPGGLRGQPERVLPGGGAAVRVLGFLGDERGACLTDGTGARPRGRPRHPASTDGASSSYNQWVKRSRLARSHSAQAGMRA